MPLHRTGSVNAANSVCLYRKQERSLKCRPIVRPCPTVGLWISHTRGPVGDHAPQSRSQPSLCFDMCAMAPETQPLPAVSRAHPPAMSTASPINVWWNKNKWKYYYKIGSKVMISGERQMVRQKMLDGHAGSAVEVSVAIQYSVVVARNGYIRNVVV